MAEKSVNRGDYSSFVSTMLTKVKANDPVSEPYRGINPSKKDPEPQVHVHQQPAERFAETKPNLSTIDEKTIRKVEEFVEKMKGRIY